MQWRPPEVEGDLFQQVRLIHRDQLTPQGQLAAWEGGPLWPPLGAGCCSDAAAEHQSAVRGGRGRGGYSTGEACLGKPRCIKGIIYVRQNLPF